MAFSASVALDTLGFHLAFNQVGVLIHSLKDCPPRNKSLGFNLYEAMRALTPTVTDRWTELDLQVTPSGG